MQQLPPDSSTAGFLHWAFVIFPFISLALAALAGGVAIIWGSEQASKYYVAFAILAASVPYAVLYAYVTRSLRIAHQNFLAGR